MLAAMWNAAPLFVAVVALLALACGPGVAQDNELPAPELTPKTVAALDELRRHPKWLFTSDACPADVMPDSPERLYYFPAICQADLQACVARCKEGDANDCYTAALSLQALKSDDPIAEALFLRACRLGIDSGCTNRAAGMTYPGPPSQEDVDCAVRTFRKTCDRDDSWGCTMYGSHLGRGEGVPRNLDDAARMLRKACAIDAKGLACRYAKGLLKQIEDAGGASPTPD